ncbi:MAG TPA: DNA polymerase III subunit gamma/tau [Candidatus Dormibacteraeota bacterium]|nr:DNA polymerase III subunit gamma/tau [Candidatus Dormibacteraeota bacterium]
MTYQTLYRKYRSQSFGDLVGQEATSRALQGAIATDRVAHAYLFSGTRGTGKTTTARLLAKAINCMRRGPGTAEPCNECESCLQVQSGSALDLIEIDAASNRGIDEIRDLREKVNLAPALGRKKVYIIDEAHMLTTEAFNALLKTLEEPPEHVVFVLCTTDANKVPLTVLGRCQQFVFRRFSDEQIVGRLGKVASGEGIVVEPSALALIANVAQGSMRDAIGMLDQLVPLADGPISLGAARDLLGIADPAQLNGLLDMILAGRAAEALDSLGRIYEGGGELRQVVRGLMERCRDQLVAAIEARDTQARDTLSAVLDSLLHLDGEVRRHAEPRFLVEATLVRLAVEAQALSARSEPVASLEQPAPIVTSSSAARPAPVTAVGSEIGPDRSAEDGWRRILESLNPQTRAYFRAARAELDGDRLVLTFPYSFHHKRAVETAQQVEPLVKSWLGVSARMHLQLQESAPAAASPQATAAPALAPEEDPVIKAAERKLEAKVVRVRPLKETP